MPLWDMLSAAREVRTMLQGVSLAQFQAALIVMRATERCIEIIGEAARHGQAGRPAGYIFLLGPWIGVLALHAVRQE